MTLTNTQFDSIQREYDAAQLKNRRILEKRRQEVFARCPAYEEAVNKVASLSVRFGKHILTEEASSMEAYREALLRLSEKKQELLLASGFPAGYLEPLYDCADCQDTGYVHGSRCHCFEQKIINLLYSQSNLQKLIATDNFSSLSYDYYQGEDLENFKKAVETSLSFIKNF